MNLIDKAFLLKKTTLFGSLDLDLLLTISDKMELITHSAEDKIFQPDQNAQRIYLIVEGKIAILDKMNKQIAELRTYEFFGDEALFSERPREYSAICLSNALFLTLTRSQLTAIMEECPSVALTLLHAYATQVDFRKR